MTKIALVIGHNARSQGAVRVTDRRTEYDLNSDLAAAIRDLEPARYVIIRRTHGVGEIGRTYAEVDRIAGCAASIELHFNSHDARSATGTETLNHVSALDTEDEETGEDGKPLSDSLIRDLTAHRTLGLRLALGEQPDMALIAVTHALAAQTFYRGGGEAHALEIRPISASLGGHADGIEDTASAKALADRHAGWASDMPRDVSELWGFIAGLDHASVMALLAHCAGQTVNALKLPWEQNKRHAHVTADRLATAVALDMTAHWTPTVRAYLGRVTKAHILDALREALGNEAAEQIADKKKPEMAEAAEQLLAGTGWLPPILRTERPSWLAVDEQPEAPAIEDEALPETYPAETVEDEPFTVAAE